MVSQKELESARVNRKGDPISKVSAPSPSMVAKRRQRSHRSTITPNKICPANFYRRIKRRVGHSHRRTRCKRDLVTTRKQAAYKLSGTQSSLSSLTRVPRPLYRQDGAGCNRQHYSSVLHKQGRRHEVGPSVCPAMQNLDLVYQEASNSQSLTHSRPAECDSRQVFQARPDHPNRVVSPSRDFPSNMQQVAPAKHRFICHEVQQQVASEAVAAKIKATQRGSTRSVYEAKWTIFTKWFLTHQVDFRAPPVKSVADFLMYLFQDRKLQPSTIDG